MSSPSCGIFYHNSARKVAWRFPNFTLGCRTFATLCAVLEKLRWLGFPLTLHCSALFNHDQVTPFIVFIAAFGRFMRRSRIPKHPCRHIYSRCEVRSGEAGMRPRRRRRVGRGRSPSREAAARARAGARTLGDKLSENAFKEMPTLANSWSNFRFSLNKAVGITRRIRAGQFQLLYLG